MDDDLDKAIKRAVDDAFRPFIVGCLLIAALCFTAAAMLNWVR